MPSSTPQRQHVLLTFVGLAVASLVGLWLIPTDSLTRVVAARAVALVATLILLRRLVGLSGPARRAWSLVWAYQALTLLADLVYADLAVLDAEPSFPNPSDVLYLITYAFAFAAVRAFAGLVHAGMDARLRMELHALMWAGAVVVTLVLVGPWLLEGSADALTPVVALAYPVLDLLLVLVVLAVLHAQLRRNRSVQLLLGGFATFLVLDIAYYLQAVTGDSTEFRLLEVGWTAALLLLTFAAYAPDEQLTQHQSAPIAAMA